MAPSARAPQDINGYLLAGDVRRSRHASCSYDVLVVGLGSMGAAAARTLAARGLRVLGLETFGAAHDQGSAHGGTRIVRQSYFEGSAYVPVLRRAYEGGHGLAQESGRDLLRLCGGIYIGDPESPVFTGSLASARVHSLEHEVLDAAEIAARFPTMRQRPVPADHPALGRARYRPAAHGLADLSQQHRRPMQHGSSHAEHPAWKQDCGAERVVGLGKPRLDAHHPTEPLSMSNRVMVRLRGSSAQNSAIAGCWAVRRFVVAGLGALAPRTAGGRPCDRFTTARR